MTTQARAIVAFEPGPQHKEGSNWRLQDIAVPTGLKDGEVLVEMVASGICHSDLIVTSVPMTYPRIVGHEGSGYIKAIGPNVTKDISIGDPVLMSFDYCTTCEMCKTGRPSYCTSFTLLNVVGSEGALNSTDGKPIAGKFFGHSSFASLSVVSQTSIVSAKGFIRSTEELKLFAPLGCGIQTGAGSILNTVKAEKTDRVLILGLGGVGLSAIMAAKISGCETIVAVDRVSSRIELAKSLGATHGFDTTGVEVESLPAAFQDVAGGLGPTVVVETTSSLPLINAGYDSLAPKGAFVFIGASLDPEYKLSIGISSHTSKGIRLLGCVEGDSVPPEVVLLNEPFMVWSNADRAPCQFIPRLIDHYRKGELPLERLAKYYKVNDFETAVHDMHTGETIKPILLF